MQRHRAGLQIARGAAAALNVDRDDKVKHDRVDVSTWLVPQFSATRAVSREPLHATIEERINQALHYTEDDIMMRKWGRAYEELT